MRGSAQASALPVNKDRMKATRPPDVNDVTVKERSETTLRLQWNPVPSETAYNYTLQYSNGTKIDDITGSAGGPVTYTVRNLIAGTEYSFTLFTVLQHVDSSGHNFSATTRPSDVNDVTVKECSETTLRLQWNPVSSETAYNYTLQYSNGTKIDDITGSAGGPLTYTVRNLTAGTEYSFTLFTVFQHVNSSGHNFSAPTRPSDVNDVTVKERSETTLRLQWNPVSSETAYNYTLQYSNGTKIDDITGSAGGPVTYTVRNLTAGTEYSFTLFTVFQHVNSSGQHFSNVTRPLSVIDVTVKERSETTLRLQWNPVSSETAYNYTLQFSNGTKIDDITGSAGGPVTYAVMNLTLGTVYNFTLITVFEQVKSMGHSFSAVTIPPQVTGLHCGYMSGGYAFSLSWNPPQGVWTQVEVEISGQSPRNVTGTKTDIVIKHVKPAQTYHITATSVSETMKSETATFECQTDPRVFGAEHAKYT
ncbi:receptor-type tyrosine-protein phosphatase H-like [Osmerus eperlanus]|uniref:receptor-type tyrosine-protein phosphatase H-like n=1 Tax=Osmerus eperlanus TaxID=29151 RepID=UPI002E0D32C1